MKRYRRVRVWNLNPAGATAALHFEHPTTTAGCCLFLVDSNQEYLVISEQKSTVSQYRLQSLVVRIEEGRMDNAFQVTILQRSFIN